MNKYFSYAATAEKYDQKDKYRNDLGNTLILGRRLMSVVTLLG